MKTSKVLNLTLKKEWYDLIESGEKWLEYREVKPFWNKRLLKNPKNPVNDSDDGKFSICNQFDFVRFARGGHFGDSVKKMLFRCNEVRIYKHVEGNYNSSWHPMNGEPLEDGKLYYVIELDVEVHDELY